MVSKPSILKGSTLCWGFPSRPPTYSRWVALEGSALEGGGCSGSRQGRRVSSERSCGSRGESGAGAAPLYSHPTKGRCYANKPYDTMQTHQERRRKLAGYLWWGILGASRTTRLHSWQSKSRMPSNEHTMWVRKWVRQRGCNHNPNARPEGDRERVGVRKKKTTGAGWHTFLQTRNFLETLPGSLRRKIILRFVPFHSKFLKFIQNSSNLFKIPRIYSKFLEFIQNSSNSFKIPRIYSKFLEFIQNSSNPFKIPRIHSKFLEFIQNSSNPFKIPRIYSKFFEFIQNSSNSFKIPRIKAERRDVSPRSRVITVTRWYAITMRVERPTLML